MDLADTVMGGLAGGGLAVARVEVARVLKLALDSLRRKGRAGKELGVVLEAVALSDEDLAKEFERLDAATRETATEQFRQALSEPENERIRTEATRLVAMANDRSQQSGTNRGQLIQNSDHGVVHAPFNVRGDYRVEGR